MSRRNGKCRRNESRKSMRGREEDNEEKEQWRVK